MLHLVCRFDKTFVEDSEKSILMGYENQGLWGSRDQFWTHCRHV